VTKQNFLINQRENSDGFVNLKISSRQIMLLNALAEYGSMGRAAIAMHTTQPAASQLLQQLEERLNVKLFERKQRGMEPTIYGEVMIRYARSFVHDFEHAESEIAELSKGASGFVRIGSVIGPVPILLTRSLLAFKVDHPQVRISIDVGTSDTLLPCLNRGELDLVFGRIPDHFDSKDLEIHFFGMSEQVSVVIARPGHRLASKEKVEFADLFDLTWILHPIGSPARSLIENALKKKNMTAKLDIVETVSLLVTTSMLESSDMISVVPRDVAMHYAKYGMVAILPIELPFSMVSPGIVTREAKVLSPAVLKLLSYFKEPPEESSTQG